MIHLVLMMSLTRKTEPGCDSGDCSIRVTYLDICFVLLTHALSNLELKMYTKLSCFVSGNNFENIGEEKKNC